MANATKNTTWDVEFSFDNVTTTAASKTVTLSTANQYVDRNIKIKANVPALSAAAATVSGSGTASGSKQASSPTVAIDAANDNILAGTITTTKPSSGYYAAVKATAPATTGITLSGSATPTVTINTAGYLDNADQVTVNSVSITGTASTTAKTGVDYYVPITAGSFDTSTLNVKTASNALKDYTENTSVAIPSEGSLLIKEGYYPNTFISLDQLLNGRDEDKEIAATGTLSSLRTGSVAWTEDGKKVTGAMGNAIVKGGAISHTLGAPTYNSTTGVFDQSCEITTDAPTVTTAGYISSTDGTKTASDKTTENHTLTKIAGSISISGTKTVKPVISKAAVTSGVTDASDGSATTTVPSSGPYVAVSSAAKTTNVTAGATISTAGYGTSANHGISGSGNVAVGASASDTTYVKIKTTSAASKTAPTASATGSSNVSLTKASTQPSSGHYIKADATAGATTVANAGWIDAGDTSTGAATSVYYTLPEGGANVSARAAGNTNPSVALTHTKSGINISETETSYSCTVSATPTAGKVGYTLTKTAGYIDAATPTGTLNTTAPSVTGAGTVYFEATSISNTPSIGGANTSGYNNPSYTGTVSTTIPQVKLQASATSGSVYNGTSTAQYINYYTGSYTIS